MANNLLQEFLVGIGFTVDEAGMAKYTTTVGKAEESVTKVVATSTDARDKIRQAENAKEEKRQIEAAKKNRERLAKSLRDFEVAAVKVAAFTAKITLGVGSLSAGGIFYAVDQTAKGFERLFYTAQRIGGTAQGITSVEYAIAQLGGTTEGAEAALNAFGDWLHNQRESTLSYLQSIGVTIKDAKGNILDAERLYANF